ncbi:MAG: HD-GYP domain-containing protein [Abditibacteriales bacterium]|nr:HD-GYP domain-containing protein [Abditibacteriales bacterium]MDW8365145.1 HD-GYP domain-containing protein [Abditibacteriales bacterium]
MRRVALDDVQPNMVLARTVMSVEGRMFVAKGTVLQPPYVEKLREAGFQVVYVLEDADEQVVTEEVISEGLRLEALFVIHNALRRVEAISKGARMTLNQLEIEQCVAALIDELIRHRHRLVTSVDPTAYNDYLAAHSVNVCILALLTGIGMGYNTARLEALGIGALLHDVGMVTVPAEVWRKAGALTPEERKQVETHCLAGWQILQANARFKATSLAVVLQHQERYDGTGYPRGLKGADIHEFARVTAVADVYDALLEHKIYHPGYPPHEAMRLIRAGCGTHFDPAIAEELLKHVAPYPPGGRVRLSNGCEGWVVAAGEYGRISPTIRTATGEEIRLAECPGVEVTEVLSY